jgi:hypothetical protein
MASLVATSPPSEASFENTIEKGKGGIASRCLALALALALALEIDNHNMSYSILVTRQHKESK